MTWLSEALGGIFSADGFIPRRICGAWPDWLIGEHLLGNTLIWLAYMAIPVVIFRLGFRRAELAQFRGLVASFGAFIILCGIGHFLDMTAFFRPLYRLSGLVLMATGAASWWTVWCLARAWPRIMEMKGPAQFARDLAERTEELRLAGERLRAGEARFRQLADAMPQIVWTAGPDGSVDYFNSRWYDFTGHSPGVEGNATWMSNLHPDDVARCLDVWYRSVRLGIPYDIEYRFHEGKSGDYRWHLGRALPARDEGGTIVRWYGTCTDIDDRKQAEAALRESEDRQRRALSAARIGHWDYDISAGRVTYQGGLRSLYGRSENDPFATFDAFLSTIHPDDRPGVEAAVGRSLRPGVPLDCEYRVVWADGTVRWLAGKGGTFFDDSGRPVRMAGVNIDITQRKGDEAQIRSLNEGLEDLVVERTAELERARQAAEDAGRVKAQFLAHMSHEIRTPMNGVLGMSELALETPLDRRQRGYIETIRSSAESLLMIIDDILDFTKVEAGKLRLDSEPFGLRDSLNDMLRAFAPRAHGKGLELCVRVRPGVPDRLVGDSHRLRQVLVNLVGNAIKFTDRGEVILSVDLDGLDDTIASLVFTVDDTGVGIDEGRRAAIFEPFEQADGSTTRRYGGTGLGLAISAQLISLMGGSVVAEGRDGGGSRFRFTARFGLDLNFAGAEGPLGIPEPPPAVVGRPVLVVDDNSTSREILAELLGVWGLEVTAVADVASAIEWIRCGSESGHPQTAALVDGEEMARAIARAASDAGLALILLATDGPGGPIGPEIPCAARLDKPVRQSDLYNSLGRIFDGPVVTEEPTHVVAEAAPVRALRVLLAEDNQVNQAVASQMLTRLGHETVVVGDGRAAVTAVGSGRFDLVLMDIEMPVMDGFAAVAAIREAEQRRGDGGRIPIVALTAHALSGDRQRCLSAGFDAYLSKPIRMADLALTLADQVGIGTLSIERSATAGDPSGPSAFRPEVLDESCGAIRSIIVPILSTFLSQGSADLNRLVRALDQGDHPALRAAAHGMKGACMTVGAEALSLACARLEALDTAPPPSSRDELCRAWSLAHDAITAHLAATATATTG